MHRNTIWTTFIFSKSLFGKENAFWLVWRAIEKLWSLIKLNLKKRYYLLSTQWLTNSWNTWTLIITKDHWHSNCPQKIVHNFSLEWPKLFHLHHLHIIILPILFGVCQISIFASLLSYSIILMTLNYTLYYI